MFQAFRRLCTRLSWAQERQQRSPPPTAVLKVGRSAPGIHIRLITYLFIFIFISCERI